MKQPRLAPTPRTRRPQSAGHLHTIRKRSVIVVVCLLAAIATGGAGLLLLAQDPFTFDALGCGSVDPTDPDNYSTLEVLNDLPFSVRLQDCEGNYCGYHEPVGVLQPSQRQRLDFACNAMNAGMTSYRVVSLDGTGLGFIAVQTERKVSGLVFAVSAASKDRAIAAIPR